MKKKLIGISGKARAGKDTIATHLWLDQGFTRIAFADPLKQAAKEIFGLKDAHISDDSLKEVVIEYWGLTPRQIFQRLGTEAVRGVFGEDVWVKRFAQAYEAIRSTDDIVVPDVREDIEAEFIRSQGGVIIQVIRDGAGLSGAEGAHRTENGLRTAAEFVIHNNSTLDALYAEVDMIVGQL